MKWALINPDEVVSGSRIRIAEVVVTPFAVAPPLLWIECVDNVKAETHCFDMNSQTVVSRPEPPRPRKLTPRQFRMRLTSAEQAAINAAVMTDPEVLDWRLRAAEASEIELDNPETSLGLDFLIFKGLLAPERKAVILG